MTDFQERLTTLCGAVALVMPSEAAIDHASLEWKMAHAAWFAAVEALGFSESSMRRAAVVGRANLIAARQSRTTPSDTQVGIGGPSADEPKGTSHD